MSQIFVPRPDFQEWLDRETRRWWMRDYGPKRRLQTKKAVRSALWVHQDGFCWYCGDDLAETETPHVEHQYPICRGGEDHQDNVVLSCGPCNKQKRNKTVEEYRSFLERRRGEEVLFWGEGE